MNRDICADCGRRAALIPLEQADEVSVCLGCYEDRWDAQIDAEADRFNLAPDDGERT